MALALVLASVVVVVVALVGLGPGSSPSILSAEVRLDALVGPEDAGLEPYRGRATWIDVYDYAPTYQPEGRPAPLGPDVARSIAEQGVRTVFLQTAGARTPGAIESPALLGRFLTEAHDAGLRVVGWYVPTFADVDADLDRLLTAARFRAGGQRFDGIAVDIEATDTVPAPATRTTRLLDLSRRFREALGTDRALAAVVPPPVLLDDINPQLWPGFPWAQLGDVYDLWIPMSYWTLRSPPFNDAASYTTENIRRLRSALGDPDAAIHVVGGIGDQATEHDYRRFVEAGRAEGVIGMSIYDYHTTSAPGFAALRDAPGATDTHDSELQDSGHGPSTAPVDGPPQ